MKKSAWGWCAPHLTGPRRGKKKEEAYDSEKKGGVLTSIPLASLAFRGLRERERKRRLKRGGEQSRRTGACLLIDTLLVWEMLMQCGRAGGKKKKIKAIKQREGGGRGGAVGAICFDAALAGLRGEGKKEKGSFSRRGDWRRDLSGFSTSRRVSLDRAAQMKKKKGGEKKAWGGKMQGVGLAHVRETKKRERERRGEGTSAR